LKITKEVVAIICLTVIAVVGMMEGFSEHFVWGIITLIGTVAGYQVGVAHAKAKPVAARLGILTFDVPFYYRKLASSICYLIGVFLLGEHLWTHGTTWDWAFPPGHELWGLIIIIAGILIGLRREGE